MLSSITERAERVICDAADFADAAPPPDLSALFGSVEVSRAKPAPAPLEPITVSGDRDFKLMHAVHEALDYSLANDPSVFVAGVDVGAGNVFGLTRGLREHSATASSIPRFRKPPLSDSLWAQP